MLLMMALVLLMIIRLLVAWIRAAFFPRVLARFVKLAVLLISAMKLRLVITSIVSAIVLAIALVVAVSIPETGLMMAVSQGSSCGC